MILFIFVLAALGFFYHRVLDRPSRARTIGSLATGAVIVVSVLALAANDLWHVGMHNHTTAQTTALSGKQVTVSPIGKHEAAYRVRLATGQARTFKPGLTTTVTLKRTPATKATLTTHTTVLKFDNALAAIMFAGSGLQNRRVATRQVLTIPDSWRVVTR